ncbi:prepilin peptidase [Patescibacteria group bacterium]|nr:prepilin peptidase [Patescibacteria group bacterium]
MIETIVLMPPYFVATVVFIFGLIIGSFLNVYIYRFHTGKSLAGSSHCLSCRTPLRFYELFPLFSYLGLLGRCRSCSALIPSRYFWVELTTGILFLWVVQVFSDVYLWPLLLVLMATLVVISVYDLAHFIIPNAFVVFLSLLALVYVGYGVYVSEDYLGVIWNVAAALLAFLFFAGLWWYSDGKWLGFGDAKLAIPLAFMIGISGVFSMIALSFWIGAFISVIILLWQKYGNRGQLGFRSANHTLTIKSEVPFAPFLIIGFLLVFMGGVDVLLWFSYAL